MIDIVIIGSGVAGLTAAIAARLAGLTATVIEREAQPPERPGETLHPGIEAIFSQLGIAEAVVDAATSRHAGILVQDANGRHAKPYGGSQDVPWRGFQLPRERLQQILLHRAIQLGAEVHFDCPAKGLRIGSDGRLSLIARQNEITPGWLFDGTGHANWLARHDHTNYHDASRKLCVCYGYDVQAARNVDSNWPNLVIEPWGWSWSADLGDGRSARVRLFTSRSAMLNNRPKSWKTMDATWRVSGEPARRNTFRIGDAALRIDPSSGRGVLRAMMSAIMAVHLVKGVKDGKLGADTAADTYCGWIRTWFQSDVRELSHLLEGAH